MLTYVAGTVSRLEESVDRGFREIRETLANHYVPRNEIDRRFDDTNLAVAALDVRVKAVEDARALEARDRQARLEQAERADRDAQQQATRDRRTVHLTRAGIALSGLLGAGSIVSGWLQHLH